MNACSTALLWYWLLMGIVLVSAEAKVSDHRNIAFLKPAYQSNILSFPGKFMSGVL